MDTSPEAKRKAKAARARMRRRAGTAVAAIGEMYKPLDEWDDEELAKGRPRSDDGRFHGPSPTWISRQVHEEALKRFTEITQGNMRGLIPTAIATVEYILRDEAVDKRGRPMVPMGVKLDAAKWVVEHLVGKPTQRVEADISVRLQSLLGNVMVAPEEIPEGHRLAIDVPFWDEDEDESSEVQS